MSRPIDADALKDHVKIFNIGCGCSDDYQKSFLNAIDEQPTIQPERPKGHWVHRGCGVFECDQCGELVSTNIYTVEKASDRFKFCPNCGADMREGEQE